MSAAGGGKSREGAGTQGQKPAGEISKWEWVAGAIGLVLVLATVGYMVRAASQPVTPPNVIVAIDSITTRGSGYLVHFTARNEGRSTAANVAIEGELPAAAGSTVVSTTTLDFVPGGSSRSGGLYFGSDPRGGALELRAAGYTEP